MRSRVRWATIIGCVGLAWGLAACDGDSAAPTYLSREAMMNPETCAECHPGHVEQWRGSMHAYAGDDPVFRAMNALGQRETDGALGDFCVKCHAPLAVSEGLTDDGTNLDDVPQHLRGVTCFFCHTVEAVDGTHNNPLIPAGDLVMRGGIADPVANTAHASAYSPLMDRRDKASASLCGSCHDVVTPAGVHLERTFSEWKDTLFAHDDPAEQLTCGQCHMSGSDGVAADYPGVKLRKVHSHAMPGVDVALTPWPQREEQRAAVQAELDVTLLAEMCVVAANGSVTVTVTLENIAAGHSWPSGAAQDRRAWVEVMAYEGEQEVFASGAVADDQPLADVEADPQLWRIGDRIYGPGDEPVHMFWEARRVESALLPAPTERLPTTPGWIDTHVSRVWTLPVDSLPERVTMRVRIRPMALDLLDELVATGDLKAEVRDAMPTFTLGTTVLEWSRESGETCIPDVL